MENKKIIQRIVEIKMKMEQDLDLILQELGQDFSSDNKKELIDDELNHNNRGVTGWMELGKKYGYWDYFKKQILEEEKNGNNNKM